MPKINVYLPDDLAEAVKEAGLPVSAICQRALEQAVRRATAIREVVTGPPRTSAPPDPPVLSFTSRAMTKLVSAQAAARAAGVAEVGTEHLLSALVADDHSLAAGVLRALEITPRQVTTALGSQSDPHTEAAPGDGTESGFGPAAGAALQLAVAESSGLGHSYLGTEHILLGLVGEPDGVAGGVLRSLGADLRITRRAVTAALAGWQAGLVAQQERAAAQADATQGGNEPGAVAADIRAELKPILARLERLEALAAG